MVSLVLAGAVSVGRRWWWLVRGVLAVGVRGVVGVVARAVAVLIAWGVVGVAGRWCWLHRVALGGDALVVVGVLCVVARVAVAESKRLWVVALLFCVSVLCLFCLREWVKALQFGNGVVGAV